MSFLCSRASGVNAFATVRLPGRPVGRRESLPRVKQHRASRLGKPFRSGAFFRRCPAGRGRAPNLTQALGTDAVGETQRGVFAEVLFDALPVILIVSD